MVSEGIKKRKAGSIDQNIEDLINITVEAAAEVHSEIGPGKPIDAYGQSMESRLKNLGFKVKKEMKKSIIVHDDVTIECSIIDLLVDDRLSVNLVAIDKILPPFERLHLSHLVLNDHDLGLLINFNEANIYDGIIRVIN